MKQKLAFVLTQPIYVDKKGNFSTDYINLIDFFIYFSKYFDIELIILAIPNQIGKFKLHFPDNIKVIPLKYKPHSRFWRLSLLKKVLIDLPFIIKKINCDIFGCIGLTGIGTISLLFFKLLKNKIPYFILLRGDRIKTVLFSESSRMKRIIKILRIEIYEYVLHKELKKGVLLLTQGGLLQKKYKKYGKNVYALNALIDENIIISEDELLKQRLNKPLKYTTINLLYVGRISREKNLKSLLKVFEKLIDQKFNVFLNIVGSGPLEIELKQNLSLKIKQKIKFWGFIPMGKKLLTIYDDSDIFILPSFTEGLPRALFEALARGCIICSSNVGGIPYYVKEGFNGFLFSPYNLNEMLLAIKKAIDLFYNSKKREYFLINSLNTAKLVTFQRQARTLKEILFKYAKKFNNENPNSWF